jgi:hypothetical protein
MTYLNWGPSWIVVSLYHQRRPNKTYAQIKDIREIQPGRSLKPMAIFRMSKNVVKK